MEDGLLAGCEHIDRSADRYRYIDKQKDIYR